MNPDAMLSAGIAPQIGIQTLQRLTQVGDRFEFVLSCADAYRFTKMARYPLDANDFRRDECSWLFNIGSELFNPYFSARFWEDCLRIGGELSAQYLKSLTLDLISVNTEAVHFPVRHLVSSWLYHDQMRVAGPQFVSDVSDLFSTDASAEQKAIVVGQTIVPLLHTFYDLVAIGFELPPGMQQVAASMSQRAPHTSARDFQVFRAGAAEISALSGESRTARLLLSARGCECEFFILDVDRVVPEPMRFAIFVLCDEDSRRHLQSSDFWACALTPLVSNSLRTYALHCLPGQKSRTMERRKIRQVAAESAFVDLPLR